MRGVIGRKKSEHHGYEKIRFLHAMPATGNQLYLFWDIAIFRQGTCRRGGTEKQLATQRV